MPFRELFQCLCNTYGYTVCVKPSSWRSNTWLVRAHARDSHNKRFGIWSVSPCVWDSPTILEMSWSDPIGQHSWLLQYNLLIDSYRTLSFLWRGWPARLLLVLSSIAYSCMILSRSTTNLSLSVSVVAHNNYVSLAAVAVLCCDFYLLHSTCTTVKRHFSVWILFMWIMWVKCQSHA